MVYMNQEQIMQIQMMQQEMNQINEKLQMIEQHISEMQELESSLEEIEKADKEEILINLGKKIYLPVKITDKNLIVNVGNKNLVKKSISETKELTQEQIKKLIVAKSEISLQLEQMQEEANNLIMQMSNG